MFFLENPVPPSICKIFPIDCCMKNFTKAVYGKFEGGPSSPST